MWSFVILDAWQSVEACRRVREAPYPVLTTQTPTPVPVAVLGCWRLQPVTLSRFVCFFNESETVVALSPQKKPPSTCSSPVLPAEVTVKKDLLCFLLQLTFSFFNLEPHSQCSWDSLTIFNGGSPGSPIIGQYCGTTSPGTIQSRSNKLAIVFLADHSVSKGGFLATWSSDSSGRLTQAQ